MVSAIAELVVHHALKLVLTNCCKDVKIL